MSGWDELARELDAWAATGLEATLWWRDDDAIEPTPALTHLLDLCGTCAVPLTLAVVPARAGHALADRLASHTLVIPVQHGYAHVNHAPDGGKGGEFPATRNSTARLQDLADGAKIMTALFGAKALPILVPPWNRIDPTLVPRLPELGFRGLSTFAPRLKAAPTDGLLQINCHLDIVQWRGDRGFIGEVKALAILRDHLAARRTGIADAAEPTGLLTHHLVHHEAGWAFIAKLLAMTNRHGTARWLNPREIFATTPNRRESALSQ